MFNLLPNNLKQKIRSEYHTHLLIVVFISILFIQISFLIFLIPSWFTSFNKEKEIILQKGKNMESSSQINLVNSKIKSINIKLSIVNTTLQSLKIIPFIDDIISKKTKDIHIKELVYTLSNTITGKITLTGISATRDSLVLFVKALEESEIFEKVDLPISNLAKDKNINFSISMTTTP